MRVLDRCRCGRHHRNAASFAKCAWPNAASITGSGAIAVVTHCEPTPTVALFEHLPQAQTHYSELGVFGCGKGCRRAHEVVAIDIDTEQPAAAAEPVSRPPSPEAVRHEFAAAMNALVRRAPAIAQAVTAYVDLLRREGPTPRRQGAGDWRGQTRQPRGADGRRS